MTAPITTDRDESASDKIAEDWVRFHGGLKEFRQLFPEMVELFKGEIEYRVGKNDLCGIVDQWEEGHGMTGADFVRLRGEIEGWIVAHSSARGLWG